MNAAAKVNERYLRALSKLLSGGLWTDESAEGGGLSTEQAALYIAGAQAKALLMAVEREDGESYQQGPNGWGHDHRWEKNDTIAMLSGLVAFLQGARVVIPKLRQKDELRDSCSEPTEGEES